MLTKEKKVKSLLGSNEISAHPLVSIIVPTYNEEVDILVTLQSLSDMIYENYEVLIVDDCSVDKTVKVVENFVKDLPRFRLMRQDRNLGVAAARNRGIKEAQGAIVVILNADVLLPKDFLDKIVPYYNNGKSWVAVLSQVHNQTTCYSRYIEAEAYYKNCIKNEHWIWCEGFSCTKEAALQVGLFPESMPGCSGEDVDFGINLEKHFDGAKDTEIIVPHIAPDRIVTYWQQQKGRGKGRTNYYFYIKDYSIKKLFVNSLLSTLWRMFKMVCGVSIFMAWRYSKYSKKKKKDFIPFCWVLLVKEGANIVGLWSSYRSIVKSQPIL